ncbi:MAG TPA: hypothetical protein DD385_07400, partial [Marinobacter sp.]|nr:hypothetical protein [Marinobacter sp.]
PIFNPATRQVPTPTDLSFSGSLDGTFLIELNENSPPPAVALDSLSGASTVDPIVLKTNGKLPATTEEANLIPNQTVFLIPLKYASGDPIQGLGNQEPPTVDAAQAATTSFKVDLVELDGNSAIRIVPTAPLAPNTRYVVGLTKDVKDASGEPLIQDPVYKNITAEDDPLISSALAPIRSLTNRIWEPTVIGFAAQASDGQLILKQDDIALSYSFTTSNDVKVLKYIANPEIWLRDQLENFVKVSTAKKVVGAALFAQGTDLEEEKPSPLTGFQKWDLNRDGSIDAADFDVNRDGKLDASDFLWASTSPADFGFADIEKAIEGALATFDPAAALNNEALAPCSAAPDVFACVAEGLGSKIGQALDAANISIAEPDSRAINLAENSVAAKQKSAVLANITGSDFVAVNEASIKLPYHLGQPSATDGKAIQAGSWKADRAFATVLNGAFEDAGLVLPQGAIWQDGEAKGKVISEAVNSLFPFPASTGDIEVPMLIMHPDFSSDAFAETPLAEANLNSVGAITDVVIFQHGITTDRSAALAFGSALVAAGLNPALPVQRRIAVVAIDQPLHGIAPATLEAKESTAKALLEGLQASEDEDLAPIKPLLAVTDANIDAAVSGTILDQVLVQVIGQRLAGTPLAEQTATIANGVKLLILAPTQYSPTGNETIDGTVQSFATDEGIQTLVGTLAVAQQTVANSGSTIPGLTPVSTTAGVNAEGVNERHFGWGSNPDYDRTLDSGPKNLPWAKLDFDLAENPEEPGASGDLFINLGNFLNTRDNLRQGALDLLNLRASLPNVPAFANATVHFVGHSLGTVNGNAFVMAANASGNQDLEIANSHLMTPASGIVRMLENSPSFAPTILAGLNQQAGLTQQDGDLQSFFGVFQAAVDTVDPINYAAEMQGSRTLISQVDGDRTTINAAFEFYLGEAEAAGFTSQWPQGYKPLQVGIGNLMINSPEAPLAGSEPLAAWSATAAFSPDPAANDYAEGLPGFTRYPAGTHGTPVLPREEKAEVPNLAEFEFEFLKNRTIAQGGEVIVDSTAAAGVFKSLVGQTLYMILNSPSSAPE